MDDFADADAEEEADGTAIDAEEDSTAVDEDAETDSTAVAEAEREAEEDAALTSG